jgi:hypothetical protein
LPSQPTPIAPDDEHYWHRVRGQYAPSPDFINLENGYFGLPAIPVQQALRRYQDQVDRENSYFLRVRFPARLEKVMDALAAFTGAGRDELLITRNAMESLNILIQGYPFAAGDAVLLARHDYDSVIDTFGMLGERKALALVTVDVPLDPAATTRSSTCTRRRSRRARGCCWSRTWCTAPARSCRWRRSRRWRARAAST